MLEPVEEGMGRLVAVDSTVGAGHKRLAADAACAVKLYMWSLQTVGTVAAL